MGILISESREINQKTERATILGRINGVYIRRINEVEYVSAIRVGVQSSSQNEEGYSTNPILLPELVERRFLELGDSVAITGEMTTWIPRIVYKAKKIVSSENNLLIFSEVLKNLKDMRMTAS